jgi:hypothetical protein
MKNRYSIKTLFCHAAALMLFFSNTVYAENIDPDNDSSQWAWGENVGWLNFEPSEGPGVTVGDYVVTGYVWAENIGWINLSPAEYGGVTNDGYGELGGYAWGENVGWISFSCEDSGTCATADYGVTIDSDGLFDGFAWGENIGWINFDLAVPHDVYTVQTSWGPGSTLITLVSFTARPGSYQVTLKWKTASEIDNAGFNIYRSETKDGDYEQINDSLIAAEGSATEGAAYKFVDDDVENRQVYWYVLEDVDLNGVSTVHGPVSATPRLIYGIVK